ncbi:MAG: hypothetical protein DRJ50_15505 [Actinobacteria bacterium]|nr:MAG: hypothetical protein DRJ50_15505 [Actinomycetota bacterium]
MLVEHESNKTDPSEHGGTVAPWSAMPFNICVAAGFRSIEEPGDSDALKAEINRRAGRCGNCGQPRLMESNGVLLVVPMKCRMTILCPSCQEASAYTNGFKDGARVIFARRANPELLFAHLTLTVPVMENLENQVNLMIEARSKLIRMRSR